MENIKTFGEFVNEATNTTDDTEFAFTEDGLLLFDLFKEMAKDKDFDPEMTFISKYFFEKGLNSFQSRTMIARLEHSKLIYKI